MKTRIYPLLLLTLCITLFGTSNLLATCPNITSSFSASQDTICGVGPQTISFNNLSSGAATNSAGYQWYLNGTLFGSTSDTNSTPTSSISAVGTYTYMLIANDTAGGCLDTSYQVVTISSKPIASFSLFDDTICPNTSIPFSNTSSGINGTSTYLWIFGDGDSATVLNPTHSYRNGSGNYNATLVVTNPIACTDTFTRSIYVRPTPTINISGDDGDGDLTNCVPAFDTITQQTVTFFNNSNTGVTYTWNFGDGTPPVTQSYASQPDTLTHLYTTFGTFTVICTATAANGCTYTDTLTVIFDKFISAAFVVPQAQTSGCLPHLVQATNGSVNATTFVWDFGDGSPIITTTNYAAPPHTYTRTGIYTISLLAYNDCNQSTQNFMSIYVSDAPDIRFNMSLAGRGCSPQTISFANTSLFITPTNNYVWDMGNGNTYPGVPPPPQQYLVGQHSVRLIGSNGCGSDTLIRTFSIDTLPSASVVFSPLEGCSPFILNASSVSHRNDTLFSWFVDSVLVGNTDSLPAQTFVNSSDSIETHEITYTLTNNCGSYDTTVIVIIHPTVIAVLNTTLNPICHGDSLIHESLSNGDSLQYVWSFGDGTSSTLAGPHTKFYLTKGIDSVSLKITGYCGTDSVKKIILIDSIPYATISVAPLEGCSPMFVSGSAVPFGNNTTSTWYRNGSYYIAGTNLPFNSFTNNGNSVINNTFRYEISNQCGSFDTTVTIKVHPAVLARMTPINPTVCLGDTLLFRNISNGDSLKILWRFSNGDTSTFSGPHERVFNTIGLDTTWLFVNGYCGIDSTFSVTTINRLPIAKIIADVDSGCEDLRVNFTNDASNGSNYSWSFTSGSPAVSSSYTPSVLFTTSGSKAVYLTVDSLGCTTRDTTYIEVYPGPVPLFTLSPLTGCSDLDVAITHTSPVTIGDTYSWVFGNGNSDTLYSPLNQTYVNNSNVRDSGYSIQLIITAVNGCSDSLTRSITVKPNPFSNFSASSYVLCEKEPVSFSDSSEGATTYKWYFGNGDSSTLQNPSHSYDTAGIYNVTLISFSSYFCSDTSEKLVTVNPNPIARFEFDTACFSYSTTFIDSSLFGPISWKWKFGDGDSSSLQNPTHLYAKDSVYNVSLAIENAFGCVDSVEHQVLVSPTPRASFGLTSACAKLVTQFIDSSSGSPIQWKWYFGDGDSSSLQNPTHVYLVGGAFNITLIVQNLAGCKDTLNEVITINTVPQTYFTAEDVCLGKPTLFQDSTVLNYPATSYFWDFGDGSLSTLTSPNYQYLNPGKYLVSLTVLNSKGCDSTYSDSVEVFSIASANFIADTVCFGGSTMLTNSSTGSFGFAIWDYGDGSPLDTNNSISFYKFYTTSGSYSVKLKVINANGCADSIEKTIIVRPTSVALFNPSEDTICLGDSIVFLNSSSNTSTFTWDFDDGNSSTLINPTHTYLIAGNYLVSLVTTNIYSCSDTLTDSIVVFDQPTANFTFDTVCFGDSTLFSNTSVGSFAFAIWDYGDGSVLDTNNSISFNYGYSSSGSYLVKLKIINSNGCADSVSKIIIVRSTAEAVFSPSPDSICLGRSITFLNSSTNASSFNWDFDDGNNSTLNNPTHTYLNSGIYVVSLVANTIYGCVDTISDSVIVFEQPAANFTFDTVCFGDSASLINNTSGSFMYAIWNYGDGSALDTNNSLTLNKFFASSGSYQVSLKVITANGCLDSVTQTIIVRSTAIAVFSPSTDSICLGGSITFLNSSTNANSFNWGFDDGNSSTLNNPTHTYLNSGIYVVSLIANTIYGCADTITDSVVVFEQPAANFTFDTVCFGDSTSLTNNSIGSFMYAIWNYGDGSALDTNNSLSLSKFYASPGSYQVSLKVITANGCLDSVTQTIIVRLTAIAVFSPSTDSICLGGYITFLNSSTNANSFNWDFDDGNSSTLNNPTHTYSNSWIYVVSLIANTNYGCADTIIDSIVVFEQPLANFTFDTICFGDSTLLSNTSVGTFTYAIWNYGDGSALDTNNSIVVSKYFATAGSYLVSLTIINADGCVDSISQTIIVRSTAIALFNPQVDSICLGNSITFLNTSSNANFYSWDFDDGNTSTLANPTHTYLNSGLYQVSLIANTIYGCADTITDSVLVFPQPIANFYADTVCFGDSSLFTNSSVGAFAYAIWNYGDGSALDTNNSITVSKYFATAGTYLASLKIININGCIDSISQIVIVRPTAIAVFNPQLDSICLGDSITFINSSSNATFYNWNFNDGNTSALTNPTHTYLNAGVYQVSLIANTIYGCADTVTNSVVVQANPVASFITDTVCYSSFTSFTNLSAGAGLTWRWSFGDGNSDSVQNPTHLYGIDSTFNATLTVITPFGCLNSITNPVVILPNLMGNFNHSLACVTRPIQFTDSSTGNPVSWRWSFGDGGTSIAQNPIHTYTTTGTFTTQLIATNAAGCGDTITKTIFVNSIPVPDFAVDTACYGSITSFTNLTTNAQPITSYFWNFGDGNSSIGSNPSYTYSAPGLYTVTLTVTNNGGCDSSISKIVFVRVSPIANFTHDTVCAGLPTSFTDISSGTPTSWKWNFGDGAPVDSTSGSSSQHIYPRQGQFMALLEVQSGANGCKSQSIKVVTVIGGVDADFSVSTPVCNGVRLQFVNNSTTGTGGIISTNWSFGDGNTSTLSSPTHLYSTPGIYKVSLYVVTSLGCFDVDSSKVVVNSNPTANFGFLPNVCLGAPTPFFDSSSVTIGSIDNWNWNFGNGNSDTLQNPANIYNNPGRYLITLQVTTDSGCTDNASKFIDINPNALVNFSYLTACVGDSIKFKDLTTIRPPDSLVSWYWEFGDGSTSILRNPAHVYLGNTQSYPVKLTVFSSLGCSHDTTIIISHLPVPSFNFGPEYYAYCVDEPVTFYDSSTIASPSSIVGWEWTLGNGYNSFFQNHTHSYDSAGSYYIKIKLTSSDGCVFYDSLLAPLIIYPKPIVDFDPIPSIVSVFRPEIYFDNKTTGAFSYVWDFDDGTTGTADYPTHLFPNVVGFYNITQYAYTSFGCVDSITKTIYIKDEFSLYVPNSFTPDKEHNKLFMAKGYNLEDFNLKIYNRWGQLIFESSDPNEGWDGTFNGADCPIDSYVYQLTCKDQNGTNHSKQGHINLIR